MKQKISILLGILFLTLTNLFAQTPLEKAEEAFNKEDFSSAIKWFETAGKQGSVRGMVMAGYMYDKGVGITPNKNEAIQWYKLAYKNKVAEASYLLAQLYDSLPGTKNIQSEAFKWYKIAAETGNADAMYRISKIYSYERDFNKYEKEADLWRRRAADSGNLKAIKEVAFNFLHTAHDLETTDKAIKHFEKAAFMGDGETAYMIGAIYLEGKKTSQDIDKAKYWFTFSDSLGYKDAPFAEGVIYEKGMDGQNPDIHKALALYKQSAKRGSQKGIDAYDRLRAEIIKENQTVITTKKQNSQSIQAASNSGNQNKLTNRAAQASNMRVKSATDLSTSPDRSVKKESPGTTEYQQGRDAIILEKDIDKGIRLYETAAQKGNVDAMAALAHLYLMGNNVSKDKKEGFKWELMAAQKGNRSSMKGVAFAYQYGVGVTKDLDQSLTWYKKLSDHDQTGKIDYEIANIYNAAPFKDINNTQTWYLKSAKKGYASSMLSVGNIYRTKKNDAEAIKWYEKAAKGGVHSALLNLGDIYSNSPTIPKNIDLAIQYYKKAADANVLGANRKYEALAKDFNESNTLQTALDEVIKGEKYYLAKNFSEALPHFRKAADAGHMGGQYYLGMMYYAGFGVQKDENEAFRLIKSAAEKGHRIAGSQLGRFYDQGIGTARDAKTSLRWYIVTVLRGGHYARNDYFKLIAKEGIWPDKEDYEKGLDAYNKGDYAAAAQLYDSACHQGHGPACYNIGKMYENGTGVQRNLIEGYKRYFEGALHYEPQSAKIVEALEQPGAKQRLGISEDEYEDILEIKYLFSDAARTPQPGQLSETEIFLKHQKEDNHAFKNEKDQFSAELRAAYIVNDLWKEYNE